VLNFQSEKLVARILGGAPGRYASMAIAQWIQRERFRIANFCQAMWPRIPTFDGKIENH
jgi:hypothetical protein